MVQKDPTLVIDNRNLLQDGKSPWNILLNSEDRQCVETRVVCETVEEEVLEECSGRDM